MAEGIRPGWAMTYRNALKQCLILSKFQKINYEQRLLKQMERGINEGDPTPAVRRKRVGVTGTVQFSIYISSVFLTDLASIIFDNVV